MPITRDLSDLPRAVRSGGNPPLPEGKRQLLDQLAGGWIDDYEEQGLKTRDLAVPEAGPYRASFASSRCDRALHYNMAKVDKSNPPSIATYWVFQIGQMVHSLIERIAHRVFQHVESEVPVDLRPLGIPGSASVDLVIYDEDENVRANVENKSIGGYGYKMSVGSRGDAKGPRWGAVVQGALANRALNSPKLFLAYFATEGMSPAEAKRHDVDELGRIAALWEYDAEECNEIVVAEAKRIRAVIDMANLGILPPRELHDPDVIPGGTVRDPSRGMWVVADGNGQVAATGSTWMCAYCDFRDLCIADGEGGSTTDGGI